jgi:dGTPase
MSRAPNLAVYACDPETSRGRLHVEKESATRTVHQRDRDRIVHSGAFRKLQYKTQVFVYHEGDYYRTRLTHSIEVAQIARSIARTLGLNEDLAEAVALAHDLGHTCFGHAGEDGLEAAMAAYGGFDHNEQTFRIVTRLEARYADFDGLNLTWETLEGIATHNGPLDDPPVSIVAFARDFDLELASHAGAEAQVAALADDIAYITHDIDDGLRAGLFGFDELAGLPLVGEILAELTASHPGLEQSRLIHETVRRLINRLVNDLLGETRRRIAAAEPRSAAEIRALARPVVAFSEAMRHNAEAIRDFLYQRMYRHARVNRVRNRVRAVVRELFEAFMADPSRLPAAWTAAARIVADYIAGMTDRYAEDAHERLIASEDRL